MTKYLLLLFMGLFMISCGNKEGTPATDTADNPFFQEYDTPHGVAPFDKIKDEHYIPAYDAGIKENREDIDKIVNNTEAPTFENTILALENAGTILNRVEYVFENLYGADKSEMMDSIVAYKTPLVTALSDEISMNDKLFQRVKAVYENMDNLNDEQKRVVKKMYDGFVRGGANLDTDKKEILKKINTEIAELTIKFGTNVLNETNRFEMYIGDEKELAGLPEAVKAGAADAAKAKGKEGQWLFTIAKPSLIPFITYADNRELRKKMFMAYANMGDNNDELDNKETLMKIANLRIKKAQLLGYNNHSEYILDDRTAKTPENVFNLLNKLWKPALENAKAEVIEMQKIADKEGANIKIEPWDWFYYAEKVRKAKYDLDEEQLRPYFKIENVVDGAFTLAEKLWGLTFKEVSNIPKYHPEVRTFEVYDADGSLLSIFYTDYFPRESKRGGAWMNAYRPQQMKDGKRVPPVITNVCNFTKPTSSTPSLLTYEEVTTLFHEFGHALHGMLSNTNYKTVAGTNVPYDMVELPSQIMENWAGEPEMLKLYAKHYETGEVIPDELIQKLKNASKFNQGFATTEYLAASILDMIWHTQTSEITGDVNEFEKKAMEKIGLIDEIIPRYRSTYFRHIFSSPVGYSSGYYGYIWAAVYDADAFEAFKETSLFDKETAKKFRDRILSVGSSVDLMESYKEFRGKEADITPLLKRRGLTKE